MVARQITVAGVSLEVEERGQGRPVLFLHPGEGPGVDRAWLDLLARGNRVIVPTHPGWGRSALPDWIGTVDDLAYLYLDLAREMRLENAVLAGACFGGWIAAEMAVRETRHFARLVLIGALGVKFGGVSERDIADMHAMTREEYAAATWAVPARGVVDTTALPETELAGIARGRESFAIFGWKPYMHNPRLRHWLHRIDIPTALIWGARDGVVSPAYAERYRAAIPGATLDVIADAGHFPHWEQPEAFATLFADRTA